MEQRLYLLGRRQSSGQSCVRLMSCGGTPCSTAGSKGQNLPKPTPPVRIDRYDRAEARLMGDVAGASFSVRAAEWLRATGGAEG